MVAQNRPASVLRHAAEPRQQAPQPQPKRPARCRNCRKRDRTHPRGLCKTCYHNPKVRRQYPAESGAGNRGRGLGKYKGPAKRTTQAEPGSPQKMRILANRLKAGTDLHRVGDRRIEPPEGCKLGILAD